MFKIVSMLKFWECFLGVGLAKRRGLERVVFECYNINAVKQLNSTGVNLSPWETLVSHFWNSIHLLTFEGLHHVSRNQNVILDRLASVCSSLNVPLFWFGGEISN